MKRINRITEKGTIILLLIILIQFSFQGKLYAQNDSDIKLKGNRFFTLSTVVRVRQIEVSRDVAHGPDESSVHTPAEARVFRETIEKSWPGARITWAFSWLALKDERPDIIPLWSISANRLRV